MSNPTLTKGEKETRRELLKRAGGDLEAALGYGAQSMNVAAREIERLWDVIRGQRLEIQRLSFPALYPPTCPEGAEAVAKRIYEAAEHIKGLMEREHMQEDFDVTYHSMCEIASYGEPA